MAALIDALALRKPLVAGYSDGGQIALEIGMRHPALPGALVVGGAFFRFNPSYSAWLGGVFAEAAAGGLDTAIVRAQPPRLGGVATADLRPRRMAGGSRPRQADVDDALRLRPRRAGQDHRADDGPRRRPRRGPPGRGGDGALPPAPRGRSWPSSPTPTTAPSSTPRSTSSSRSCWTSCGGRRPDRRRAEGASRRPRPRLRAGTPRSPSSPASPGSW